MSLIKDVAFLPGFGFKSSISQLVFQHINSIIVHPFDLPYGKADLTAVIHWLRGQVNQPVIWVGWSLGGLIALAFCHRYPLLCRKLIMICSTPKFMAADYWPGISHQALQKFEKNFLQNTQRCMRNFVHNLLLPCAYHETFKQLSAYLDFSNSAASLHALTILRHCDLRAALQSLDLPVQLLLAENDALLPSDLIFHLSKINSHVKITSLAGMSHTPFITHPQTFTGILSECMAL